MCNSLHPDSKPIPESGFGYKLFERSPLGEVRPVFGGSRYVTGKEDWITWNADMYWSEKVDNSEFGFCFFRTKRVAERMLAACIADSGPGTYKNCFIRKIKYRKGLGCHQEEGIVENKSFRTALCKEFKILEEEVYYGTSKEKRII